MFIYLTKTEKGFFPVMAMKAVEGGQELKPVAGYYIHRLQEFVRNNPSLPQDGYYAPVSKAEYDDFCDALEDALTECPRVSEVDEVMPFRFVLDEDGKKVVMETTENYDDYYDDDWDEDCDEDCDCDDDEDEDDEVEEEVEKPEVPEELRMLKEAEAVLKERLAEISKQIEIAEQAECAEHAEDENPAHVVHITLHRRLL